MLSVSGKWVETFHDGRYTAIHRDTGWYFQQSCTRGQYDACRRNRDKAWHVTLAKQLNITGEHLSMEEAVAYLEQLNGK